MCVQYELEEFFNQHFFEYIFFILLYIHLLYMLHHGQYPYKWLWDYAGDNILKPGANKLFHRCRPTTYYYCWARSRVWINSYHWWATITLAAGSGREAANRSTWYAQPCASKALQLTVEYPIGRNGHMILKIVSSVIYMWNHLMQVQNAPSTS